MNLLDVRSDLAGHFVGSFPELFRQIDTLRGRAKAPDQVKNRRGGRKSVVKTLALFELRQERVLYVACVFCVTHAEPMGRAP